MFRLLALSSALLFLVSESYAQKTVSFSTGVAKVINSGLVDCGRGSRASKVGTIETEDGLEWTVPAATNYATAQHATDLYNECDSNTPGSLAEIDLSTVPVADAGGLEEFTAYIFADNYFEFFANGTLVAVDAVPFTPFNSSVLKFKAERPVSVAIMGVDWEENLALGSEKGRGSSFQPGDAGVVAVITDATGNVVSITDKNWRAQTFYTSPINDRDCLTEEANVRDSSSCSTKGANSPGGLSAAFWPVPAGWEQPDFDASGWPEANAFTNDTVGVKNKPGYTNFTEIFDNPSHDAQFIWSSNLVLDNLVLMRTKID